MGAGVQSRPRGAGVIPRHGGRGTTLAMGAGVLRRPLRQGYYPVSRHRGRGSTQAMGQGYYPGHGGRGTTQAMGGRGTTKAMGQGYYPGQADRDTAYCAQAKAAGILPWHGGQG